MNYQGDFSVFVDDDGTSGYIIVRHNGFFCIEQLDPTFTHGIPQIQGRGAGRGGGSWGDGVPARG